MIIPALNSINSPCAINSPYTKLHVAWHSFVLYAEFYFSNTHIPSQASLLGNQLESLVIQLNLFLETDHSAMRTRTWEYNKMSTLLYTGILRNLQKWTGHTNKLKTPAIKTSNTERATFLNCLSKCDRSQYIHQPQLPLIPVLKANQTGYWKLHCTRSQTH